MLTAFYALFRQTGAGKGSRYVFKWQHDLFVFMICIVYFFGGLVKINHDWFILQQPTRTLLEMNREGSLFPNLLKTEFAVYYITYGGLFFDLLIPFLLLMRRTFPYALVLTLIFHITNIFIFNVGEGGNIGVFPIMMIGANILFAPAGGFRKMLSKVLPGVEPVFKENEKQTHQAEPENAKAIRTIVYGFVIIQLLLPARPHLISNRASWTGQGDFFAWRMKLNTKQVNVTYYFQENAESPKQKINIGRIINTMQINFLGQHADMIYKFSQYLHKRLLKETGKDLIITADIFVSMNGREPARLVDPETNLAKVKYSPFKDPEWVLPAPK